MPLPSTLQGRPFGAAQLRQIQALISEHPKASRYQLSRLLASHWNWRTASNQLKDMAARTLLLKLHRQGHIQLPPVRMASPTRSGRQPARTASLALATTPIEDPLQTLGTLLLEEVSQPGDRLERAELEACLEQYHYLGYRSRVGQNLQYWVRDEQCRPLACVVFGAAAWQCAVRDQWIGWSSDLRAARLNWIVNNTRFLILPWVRVPRLASSILGRISNRIAADWKAKYQQPLYLLETFVDTERFAGTCYRAANWMLLGRTQGRGRQGGYPPPTTAKRVYVYPLHPHFRQHLNQPS